jgi:hypothetical protein
MLFSIFNEICVMYNNNNSINNNGRRVFGLWVSHRTNLIFSSDHMFVVVDERFINVIIKTNNNG